MKLSQPPLQHPPSPPCAGFFFCLFDASLYLFHSLFLFFHFLPLPPMDLGAQDIHFPRPGLSSLHSGASIRKRLTWAPSSTAPPRLRQLTTSWPASALLPRWWRTARSETACVPCQGQDRRADRAQMDPPDLIDCRNGEVAIKSMNETCGPCYYDRPLVFLAQADAPVGPYSASWCEQVCAFHANRCVNRVSTRRGVRILYGDHTYVLRYSLGRRGGDVALESDCLVFRLKSRQATWQRDGVAAQATMEGRFQRHVTVPSCTRDPFAQDMLKWSPTVPPPPRPVWTCSGPPPSV